MKNLFYGILITIAFSILALSSTWESDILKAINGITKEKYPDADCVIVLDETNVRVEDSGLSHVEKRQIIKVLTEKGASRYTALRFDYDPMSSYAEVKDVSILREFGKEEKIPLDNILDLPQPQEMIYWGPRMKLVPIPKLQPGDALEIKTYSKGFVIAYLKDGQESAQAEERYIPPMRGHYYDVVLFQSDSPIVEKRYTITLPKNKPLNYETFHGEFYSSQSFNDKSLTYKWWKRDIPPAAEEPRSIEPSDYYPKLVLATVPDWKEKSRWFFKVNESAKVFDSNDEIKAKVKEITNGLNTDDEKREALLHWVANQIRYSGITMGKGEGYTLHPGIMTFNDRAGVCKDIAGMLVTMFRAAGYNTYPAMTEAGSKVEYVPADQFNHCVVAVEIEKGRYKLYDPTWCPFSREIWSSAEKPQNYLVGSPEGEELTETSVCPPSDNAVNLKNDCALMENGNLAGTLKITGKGYSETNLRWGVVYAPASELRANMAQWITRISPAAFIESVDMTDPYDLKKPFEITIKYSVPSYAVVEGKSIYFGPPLSKNPLNNRRLGDFFLASTLEKRKTDIFLRAPRDFTFEENIKLPDGYALIEYPKKKPIDGPAAFLSAELSGKGNNVHLSERLIIKEKIVSVEDYSNLKEVVDTMQSFANQICKATSGGGK